MTALAELTSRWDAYYRAVEENEGVVTPEMEAEHEVLRLDTAEKVDGYVFRIKAFEGEVESLKALEAEIQGRRKAKEAEIQRLEDRVACHMDVLKVTELKGAILKGFKLQSAGGKQGLEIVVEDPHEWHPRFQKTTVTIDTERVRAALNGDGILTMTTMDSPTEPIVAARLKPRGRVLRMYV